LYPDTNHPVGDASRQRPSLMNTARALLLGILVLTMAAPSEAQQARPRAATLATALGGQSFAVSPRVQNPTPLFFIGDLAAGIWTRVPPPYDATANRTAASNPLP
jgi:hypothetical protein